MRTLAAARRAGRLHERRPSSLALFAALVAALVMGACGSSPGSPDAPPPEPTLAAIRADIFNGACASADCHGNPTLAAKLDLQDNGLCRLLVSHPSCLFPSRFLVLPGKPEASFLMDKLRGTALDGTPDPSCATTNERMPPPGMPPLSDRQISQIEAWIKMGADCGDDVGPPADAGVDAGPGLADVVSAIAGATMIHVGETTQVAVTLTHGAPAGGQLLIIDIDDASILGVQGTIPVDQGVSSLMFPVTGNAPGMATITVASGVTSQAITFMVISPTALDDKHPATQLAGWLPEARPMTVAQPRIGSNSNPACRSSVDFPLTLLDNNVTSISLPHDVVSRGPPHPAGLQGAVSLIASPRYRDIAAGGHSVSRTGVTAREYQATPASSNHTL